MRPLWWALALLIFWGGKAAAEPAAVLLRGVRVVDARGDQGTHDLLIAEGRIAALDPAEIPEGTQVLDAKGKTVVPGLVDSHLHVTMAPAQAFRKESDEALWTRHATHLRALLAWGVTTVVDPGITLLDQSAQTKQVTELEVLWIEAAHQLQRRLWGRPIQPAQDVDTPAVLEPPGRPVETLHFADFEVVGLCYRQDQGRLRLCALDEARGPGQQAQEGPVVSRFKDLDSLAAVFGDKGLSRINIGAEAGVHEPRLCLRLRSPIVELTDRDVR